MDWIRTMNNTPNISGTGGKLLNVTEEELAKHNKKTDCWTAISGKINRDLPSNSESSSFLFRERLQHHSVSGLSSRWCR